MRRTRAESFRVQVDVLVNLFYMHSNPSGDGPGFLRFFCLELDLA